MSTISQRGRKPKPLSWPNSRFTVEDIATANKGKISRVAIQLRINKAVESGELKVVGKEGETGRKRVIYSSPQTTTTNPVTS